MSQSWLRRLSARCPRSITIFMKFFQWFFSNEISKCTKTINKNKNNKLRLKKIRNSKIKITNKNKKQITKIISYVRMRSMAASAEHKEGNLVITTRMLESMIRLATAHAKLKCQKHVRLFSFLQTFGIYIFWKKFKIFQKFKKIEKNVFGRKIKLLEIKLRELVV